jgi:hypothetical protein
VTLATHLEDCEVWSNAPDEDGEHRDGCTCGADEFCCGACYWHDAANTDMTDAYSVFMLEKATAFAKADRNYDVAAIEESIAAAKATFPNYPN